MSFLSDIAELAKAGYKPQDVKELLSMSKPETFAASPLPGEPADEPSKEVQPPTEPTQPAEQPAETAPKASAQPTDEPDYKALYEAEKEKVKILQNKNAASPVGNTEYNEAELLNKIRDFC